MSLTRLATAIVLLPLIVLYILKLGSGYFALLIALVSTAALYEFYAMYRVQGVIKLAGIASGIAIIATVYKTGSFTHAAAASAILILTVRLFSGKTPQSALSDTAPVLLGVLYIPCLLSYQVFLRGWSPELIIFLYACVWGADSFAYYIGTWFGRMKLYPSVSPNKTVEGAFGSLAGGVISALLIKVLLIDGMTYGIAAASGAVIGIVSIAGDLVESMFKRDAGVKDSSALIPGHGGMLDKIDGSLYCGPILYFILTIAGYPGK